MNNMNNTPNVSNKKSERNESSSSSLLVVAKEKNSEKKLKIGSTISDSGNSKENKFDIIPSENENEANLVSSSDRHSVNWKDDIHNSCMNIFCNFAKFNNEEKDFFISHQNLCKILRTMCILDMNDNPITGLKMSNIDVLLKKVIPNGKKLNGKQFMNFIVLLSNKMYPDNFSEDPQMTVVKVIKTFFEPFSNFIENTTNQIDNINKTSHEKIFYHKNIENKISTLKFDSDLILVLNSVYNGIKNIYTSYFYYEMNKFNDIDKMVHGSFNNLIEFCKNFEIIPYIITLEKLAIFYNLIFDLDVTIMIKDSGNDFIFGRDLGIFFTISKFAVFIVHMALMSFEKLDKINIGENDKNTKVKESFLNKFKMDKLTLSDKLIFFLERLESSKGIKYLEKKNNKPCNAKMSLIPPKEVFLKINSDIIKFSDNETSNYSTPKKYPPKSKTIQIRNCKSKPLENNLNNNLVTGNVFKVKSEENIKKISENLEVLREIFDFYSQIGEKFNSLMTLTGFTKFLKDCKLIYQPVKKTPLNNSLLSNLKSISKSPLKSKVSIDRSSSCQSIKPSMSKKIINCIPVNRRNSQNSLIGIISESDISIIFAELTGVKNFDNTEKIKNHFNKNKGYSQNIHECIRSPKFTNTNSKKILSENNIQQKMNFNLFLKSFQLIAAKLHPGIPIEQAISIFIENDISNMINEYTSTNNIKRNILEALTYIRQDEITDVLKELNDVLLPHYLNYCNKFGLIIFDNFLE